MPFCDVGIDKRLAITHIVWYHTYMDSETAHGIAWCSLLEESIWESYEKDASITILRVII